MKYQYKGGLHIHTSISDGRKSPEETLAAYKVAGYDFVALTDHWHFGEAGDYGGMKILSGIEYDIGENVNEGIFHIVGIGAEHKPKLERSDLNNIVDSVCKAQFIIDRINEAGGAAILAHPAWSLDRVSDIKKLQGLAGVEMYNAFSGFPFGNRACSDDILDRLAADGYVLPVHASDDTHFWGGEECSSFVFTPDNIFDRAIKHGELYASRGPQMEITREGNTLHIECSPVKAIIIQTGAVWINDRVTRGDAITSHVYEIKPSDIFARVEIIDEDGNFAWSGYYLL